MTPLIVFGFWYACFSDGQPVDGGYLEEQAPTIEQAIDQFSREHNCHIYRIDKNTRNADKTWTSEPQWEAIEWD
jgi:hypothetical protein